MTNVRIKKKKPKTHFTEFSALSFAFSMPIQLNFHIFQNYFLIWSWHYCISVFYLFSSIAFFNAFATWSGQLVPRPLQLIPSIRLIASCAFIPLRREAIPCRFPLHPPTMLTFKMVSFSSSSTTVFREHTPLLVYSVIIYFSLQADALISEPVFWRIFSPLLC